MGREPDAAEIAFEDVYWELFSRAYRVALRLVGEREAAEDIAAEALARVYQHWRKLKNVEYQEAWVMKVASNLALDLIRRRPAFMRPTPVLDPDDAAVTRVALVAALQGLPRRQQEVVTLRYLGGLPEDDVARALGIAPGTVRAHLQRGLENLRGHLAERGEGTLAP